MSAKLAQHPKLIELIAVVLGDHMTTIVVVTDCAVCMVVAWPTVLAYLLSYLETVPRIRAVLLLPLLCVQMKLSCL
jgi:N-acyl-D-aspartate/D-glutamate deacylase